MISVPKALRNPRRDVKKAATNGSAPGATNGRAPAPGRVAIPSQGPASPAIGQELLVDLERRRDQLIARVAELQWDLGGLAYEMAIRNQMKVDVLVKRAVALQDADAELSEVERIVRTEETGTAGSCSNCNAPHSSGATYCWQCGQPLLAQVSSDAILRR
jgi:hypothetical protein